MDKTYFETVTGYCPFTESTNSISVKFMEFEGFSGRKKDTFKCSEQHNCPYVQECPIYNGIE